MQINKRDGVQKIKLDLSEQRWLRKALSVCRDLASESPLASKAVDALDVVLANIRDNGEYVEKDPPY